MIQVVVISLFFEIQADLKGSDITLPSVKKVTIYEQDQHSIQSLQVSTLTTYLNKEAFACTIIARALQFFSRKYSNSCCYNFATIISNLLKCGDIFAREIRMITMQNKLVHASLSDLDPCPCILRFGFEQIRHLDTFVSDSHWGVKTYHEVVCEGYHCVCSMTSYFNEKKNCVTNALTCNVNGQGEERSLYNLESVNCFQMH